MDKGIATVVAALIGAIATIIVGIIGPYGLLQRENSQLQEENASLQEENTALQERTSDTDADELREQVSGLQNDIAALRSQIEELRNDNAGLQAAKEQLQQEKDQLAQENERLKQSGGSSATTDSGESALSTGESFDLLSVCPPYEKSDNDYEAPNNLSIMGTKYKNAFCLGAHYGRSVYAFFSLNGQYSQLEFDVGHVDGSAMREKTLMVYLGGELQDPIPLNPKMTLAHYSFKVSGINQVRLEIESIDSSSDYAQYGFVNAKLYS